MTGQMENGVLDWHFMHASSILSLVIWTLPSFIFLCSCLFYFQ